MSAAVDAPPAVSPAATSTTAYPDAALPAAVRALWRWALIDGDAAGRPFAVVDKPDARVFVFEADGQLAGSAPALLGLARGDLSAPGVGAMVPSAIPPELRTTPAGRFVSRPGRNLGGEAVVWIDYDAGVALHRLRPAPPHERRPQRLASSGAADKRITLGCVVVEPAFYASTLAAVLGRGQGVVYVLPDTLDWREVFQAAAGH